MKFNFVGLDISLTGTGLVVLDELATTVSEQCITSKPMANWFKRENIILDTILSAIPSHSIIFVEDYAFAAHGKVFNIAELSGLIKYALYKKDYPIIRIPPTSLKKFTTGTGTAGKELMLKEVYKRYGFDTTNNNIADAYALARMGHAMTVPNNKNIAKYQEQAISKVWSSPNNYLTENDLLTYVGVY